MCKQGQIDSSQLRRSNGQHLGVGLGVVKVGDDHVHPENTADKQILRHGGQLLLGTGYQKEVGGRGDELPHHCHGDCRGGAKNEDALRGIFVAFSQAR